MGKYHRRLACGNDACVPPHSNASSFCTNNIGRRVGASVRWWRMKRRDAVLLEHATGRHARSAEEEITGLRFGAVFAE
jgi:hypothetical protein